MPDTSSAARLQQRVIKPKDLLRHMQVPEEPGLYVLGCFEQRVTLLSQQVRALNLVYALCEEGLLRPGGRVCIIGGGAAGMTAAAAAARRGCCVVLLERRSGLLPLFHGNHTRWLHPYVYDWPEEHRGRPEGVEPDEAGLPLLSWRAGQAGDVAIQLERAWEELPERESHIKVIPDVLSIQLGKRQAQSRSMSWNAPGFTPGEFDIVVLAVGFGQEHKEEGIDWLSYWRDDQLHQEVLDERRRYLISGCGDGGLVDLLRVRLRRFEHEKVVEEFLSSPLLEAVKRRLLEIEEEALDAREREGEEVASKLLTRRYLEIEEPDDFKEVFQKRLRPDTQAVLNGREEAPLTLRASILNRFLVSRLLLRGVEYRWGEFKHARGKDGRYEVRFNSGRPEHFDRIICRWGAVSAAEEGFPELQEKFKCLRSRNELDQTRWRLWPSGYFDPEPGGQGAGGVQSGSASARAASAPGARAAPAASAPRAHAAPVIGVPTGSLRKGYKGREESLQRLHALLRGSESVVLTGARTGNVFAHGGGGIGKSRLAIEYAWRYQQDYPGGTFFAVVKERSPVAVWAEFARALFKRDLPKDNEAALEFARWLEDPAPGQRLIILDEMQAASPGELAERFAKTVEGGQVIWPPAAGHVSLLVTTRMREFPGAVGFEVRQLAAEFALELLLERAARASLSPAEREAAAELASKVLGGHPLALTLAGAYVRRLGLSFAEYKEALARDGLTNRLEAAAREVGYKIEDHERSIVATYELSRRQLDAQRPVDGLAWRLLQVAAFLAPNVPIDRKLLLRLLARQGEAVSAEELGQALARLVDDLSLIDGIGEEGEWTGDVMIYPLVADYTRGSMEQGERKQLQAALLSAMTDLFPDGGPPEYWHVVTPGAHPAWEWLSPSRVSHALELWKASEGCDSRERWLLTAHLGDLFVFRADLASAREFYRAAINVCERLAESDPGNAGWQRDLSVSLNKLGDVLVAQGALAEARRAFEQALAIRERLAESDPGNAGWQRDLSVSLNKLGEVLVAQGALAEARRAFEQALAIRERLAESDPGNAGWQRDLSVSLNKLGEVLVAQGALPEARRAFEQALAIAERLAQSDPGNVIWQTDFIYAVLKLSGLLALGTAADRLRGQTLLKRAQDILTQLSAESRLTHQQSMTLVPAVEKLLREISGKPGTSLLLQRVMEKFLMFLTK